MEIIWANSPLSLSDATKAGTNWTSSSEQSTLEETKFIIRRRKEGELSRTILRKKVMGKGYCEEATLRMHRQERSKNVDVIRSDSNIFRWFGWPTTHKHIPSNALTRKDVNFWRTKFPSYFLARSLTTWAHKISYSSLFLSPGTVCRGIFHYTYNNWNVQGSASSVVLTYMPIKIMSVESCKQARVPGGYLHSLIWAQEGPSEIVSLANIRRLR